jgi:hypothetical protein
VSEIRALAAGVALKLRVDKDREAIFCAAQKTWNVEHDVKGASLQTPHLKEHRGIIKELDDNYFAEVGRRMDCFAQMRNGAAATK